MDRALLVLGYITEAGSDGITSANIFKKMKVKRGKLTGPINKLRSTAVKAGHNFYDFIKTKQVWDNAQKSNVTRYTATDRINELWAIMEERAS